VQHPTLHIYKLQKPKTMTYEVTNQEAFSKVKSVEIQKHRNSYDVCIDLNNRETLIFSGEHGAHDYEELYGFVLVS
jgi:hypothetical protein